MDDAKLSLGEHLQELRSRLWKVVLAVLVLGGASLAWARELFGWLMAPVLAALPPGARSLVYTSGIEEINVLLKVGLYAGLFLATPVALYQLWSFIAPGLLKQERRIAGPFVGFGTAFFVGGAAFCYFVVLPTMFQFLLQPGESSAVRRRADLAAPQAEDAARLLALGEIGRARAMALGVDAALGEGGDGQVAAPPALTTDPVDLKERFGRFGRLLDAAIARGPEGVERAAAARAVELRAKAQGLFDRGRAVEAAAGIEEAASSLARAYPGEAAEAFQAVWASQRHVAAAQSRLAQEEWTRPMLTMREQLSLVLLLEVAFGAIFELPLVMALLALAGLLKFRWVARYQRHAILACVTLAAVITPSGDAVNLALMAVPMIVCFEVGVLLVFLLERRRDEQRAAAEKETSPAAP